MEIKIEKGIPLPLTSKGMTPMIRALMRSEVGDSVYIPPEAGSGVRIRAHQLGGPGWYMTRAEANGVRIWKTNQ